MTEQSIVEKSSVYISANHEYFKYVENEMNLAVTVVASRKLNTVNIPVLNQGNCCN